MSNFFPSDIQKTLLKAALLNNEEALGAWNVFKVELDKGAYLDNACIRLLPLLYNNLKRNGITDKGMTLLHKHYEETLNNNLKLFQKSEAIIKLFHDNNIETYLLKGLAYVHLYYKDVGLRPMSDADILIPPQKTMAAIDLLIKSGWNAEYPEYLGYKIRYEKGMMFYDRNGFQIDLHWIPFFESNRKGVLDSLLSSSVKLKVGNTESMALNPENNLIHTFIHGMKYNPEPPVRWIADAIVLIDSCPQFNWTAFVSGVKQYAVSLQVREAVKYICENFDARIPKYVSEQLSEIKVSKAERLIYKYDSENTDELPRAFRKRIYYLYIVFLRQSKIKKSSIQIFGFLRFLLFRLKGKSYLGLVGSYIRER